MTDSLNIAESVREGERRLRVKRRWRWFGFLLIILVVIVAQFFANFLLRPPSRLYAFDGTAWNEIMLPENEAPSQVTTTNDGSVWVSTLSDCGFLRYREGNWSECSGNTGAANDYQNGTSLVATHEDDIWAVYDNSILSFDGTSWKPYDNVLPNMGVNDIEASDLGVFIIDWYGNITRFDGNSWTTQNAANVLPIPPLGGYGGAASLTKTTDGTIYVAYNSNIYSYDGTQWKLLALLQSITVYQLYDGGDNFLWVVDNNNSLGVINLDGQPTFTPRNAGLINTYPTQFLISNGVPTVLTSEGIYQWETNRWRQFSVQPPKTTAYSQTLATDTSGTLWIVSHDQSIYDPYSSLRRDFALFLRYGWWVIGIGGLILMTLIHPGAGKRARETQKLVWATMYDTPDLVTVQAGGGFYRVWSMFLVLVCLFALLAYLWAEFRGWTLVKILSLLVVLLWIALPIILRARGYKPARRSLYVEDHILAQSHRILAALLIGVLLYVPVQLLWERFDLERDLGVILLPLVSFYLAWFVQKSLVDSYVKSIIVLHKMKDDQAVQAQLAWMERFLPMQRDCLAFRADLKHLKGELHQASLMYRQVIYQHQTEPRPVSINMVNLAEILEKQGCHDQALPLIECAIKIMPESALGYSKLAEHYQQRDLEPERTQALVTAAAQFA